MNVHVHMKVEKIKYATYRATAWLLDDETGEVLKNDQFNVTGDNVYQRTMGVAQKAARYLYKPEEITSSIDFIDMTKGDEDYEATNAEAFQL